MIAANRSQRHREEVFCERSHHLSKISFFLTDALTKRILHDENSKICKLFHHLECRLWRQNEQSNGAVLETSTHFSPVRDKSMCSLSLSLQSQHSRHEFYAFKQSSDRVTNCKRCARERKPVRAALISDKQTVKTQACCRARTRY